MKRGTKLAILFGICLLLVGGCLLLSNRFGTEDGSSDLQTIELPSFTPDEIQTISYHYNGAEIALEKLDSGWAYAPDHDFPLDSMTASSIASAVSNLSASRSVEAGSSPEEYGLADPAIAVTVTSVSGASHTYRLGNRNALLDQYYLSVDDDKTVYLVDASLESALGHDLFGLAETEEIPYMPNVTCLTVQKPGAALTLMNDASIQAGYSAKQTWYSADGGQYQAVGSEECDSLLDEISGLTFRELISYHASEDDLSLYGLDAPQGTVTVYYLVDTTTGTGETNADGSTVTKTETNSRMFTVEFGSYVGDYCYARVEGSEMIYLVDASTADSLLLANAAKLRSHAIVEMDWDTVKSIDVSIGSETETILFERSEINEGDGNTAVTTAYVRGSQTVAPADMDELKSAIDQLRWNDQTASDGTSGAPEVTVAFHRDTAAYSDMVLNLYPYGSTAYRASFNGAEDQLLDAVYVENLIAVWNEHILGMAVAE